MKHYTALLFLLMASAAAPQEAHAQGRMQDLSLSPEDSFKQPNIDNHPVQQYQSVEQRRAISTEDNTAAPATRPDPSGGQERSFMTGFCDPSFVPLLANNRRYFGKESCLKAIRDDSCSRFNALPNEVKAVLDDALSCLFAHGPSYASDAPSNPDNEYNACGYSYGRRMEMLKKYSSDYYTNYALIYLPDDVLDTAGRCVNRTPSPNTKRR